MNISELPSSPLEGPVIPPEVSLDVVQKTTGVLRGLREAALTAEEAYRELLKYYWASAESLNGQTRQWLMDQTFEICLEGEIDSSRAGDIWADEQRIAFDE